MPDSTVYEVEISTQQRSLMDTRQKHEKSSVGCLDRMLSNIGEREEKRVINSSNQFPSPIR